MKWKYLQPGDIIDVIAPSSWCHKQDMKEGIKYLEKLGFHVRLPKNLIEKDFVYANTVPKTLSIMKNAFYNMDSKAIWCLRGGSGSYRLIPSLMKWKRPKKTKLFIGISDVTLLHLFLNQQWNWPTLHAPMISMLAPKKISKKEKDDLERVILGKTNINVFDKLTPMNKFARKRKKIHSKILGGNLCLVENTLGTPYQADFKNKIVFLEDIDERGYAIERSLEHLRDAGAFKNIKAVVFGDFVGGEERDGSNLTYTALKRFAERSSFPVFSGLESGHGPLVRSLPLNTDCDLFFGSHGTLVCQSGGGY